MIPLEHLGLMPATGTRHGQISNQPSRGFQITSVIPIALISTLCAAFIGLGSDEGRHFFLQYLNESQAHRFSQSLLDELGKVVLTYAR